jgi:cytochrome c-type biogenesis protein CcmE
VRFWLRCAVFFGITCPVLYIRDFHLAFWQYFALGLVAALVSQGVWLAARKNRPAVMVAAIVATLADGGIAAYALMASRPTAMYLVEVEEVAARPDDFKGRRVRLHGYAKPGSLVRSASGLELVVAQHDRGVTVRYAGLAPDQLRDGMEIVAAGRLAAPGRFDADELLVKCPSNYDRNVGAPPF